MKHIYLACGLFLTVLSVWGVRPARAAGHLADVAVINRETGQQLETYYHRGAYWVAGEPGEHYAIYIRNRLGERVLAVTSVDGVNVLSGQSAGWEQGGYVLGPWESCQVTGWRKSDYQVAAFAFTAPPRSYAARTGRPENIGVIGVALFREQPSGEVPTRPSNIRNGPSAAARTAPPAAERAQRQDAPGAASPPASADLSSNATADTPLAREPGLGTAHGQREYSYVVHTHFVRRHSWPDEIIRIRYDSLDNLIAMGIVRPHRYAQFRPNPFPANDGQAYVPDPPPFDTLAPR